MDPAVHMWFSELTNEQREIADDLRDIVTSRGTSLREELRWNQPCYLGRSIVCYIQKAKKHVSLGFKNGTTLIDPDGSLEGIGSQMRHVKVALGAKADRVVIAKFVDEAIALDGSE